MLSVKGVYENGQVTLIEPIPNKHKARVIVTIIDDLNEWDNNDPQPDIHAFDSLVGVIDVREDGSEAHDQYLSSHKV